VAGDTVGAVPRKPRLEVENGLFHVATRGVDTDFVYTSAGDRHLFLRVFETVVDNYRWECHAYALLGTHYHLLIRTPNANLAAGMQLLNGRYAQTFNVRHGRRGHLFGERYFSALIDDDRYLHSVHRYIALNPVKAGLVQSPAEWRWGSFRAIAGLAPAPRFLNVIQALSLFDLSERSARVAFAALITDTPTFALPYYDALTKYVGV
jgi:putative transposase